MHIAMAILQGKGTTPIFIQDSSNRQSLYFPRVCSASPPPKKVKFLAMKSLQKTTSSSSSPSSLSSSSSSSPSSLSSSSSSSPSSSPSSLSSSSSSSSSGQHENSKLTPDLPSSSSFMNNSNLAGERSVRENEETEPTQEQIGAGFRIVYSAGVYAVMAFTAQGICHFTGLDNAGGFDMCPHAVMQGLGFAVPPMMVLLLILDDEVVRKSPAARAIRDVEDEELLSFFVGMSPCQLVFMLMMDAVAEEFFFRIAIQGGLAHAFLGDGTISGPFPGVAALTGVFPFIAPFAHAVAAVITAALTGSILFISSFPQDPAYVITRVERNCSSTLELKRSFSAWYERRQMRRIYSPLLDSLLALYLGFEWLQTGNILAPIITHVIYSTVIVGNGLRRIHEQRDKLRLRTKKFRQKEMSLSKFRSNME